MLLAFENTLKGIKEDKEALTQAAELIKASEELTSNDNLGKSNS